MNKPSRAGQAPPDQTVLHGQIAATDREIDRLVYELYGLTAEEIKMVEEGTNQQAAHTRIGAERDLQG